MKTDSARYLAGLLLLAGLGETVAEQRVLPLEEDVRIEVDVSQSALEVSVHQRRELILDAPDLSGVSVDTRGGVVSIRAGDPAPRRLRLTVHSEVQLGVSGGDSELSVQGIRGPVILRNHTQPITVEDIHGPLDVASRTGRITIRRIEGDVLAESNTNAIDIREVTGDVRARSTTSSVALQDSRSTVVELQSVSGIVSYMGEIPRQARYRLGTHSGEVILRAPERSDATLLMYGRPAAFDVNGTELEITKDDAGRVRLGDGRAQVMLESVLGAIRVSVR